LFGVNFPTRQIAHALRGESGLEDVIDTALKDLLALTDSRAVGLWRVDKDALVLAGFAARTDMPKDIQESFAQATREVSLTQTRLGIVSAVNHKAPAVAVINAGPEGLVDSAGWLAKFQAVQSLSVPIVQQGRIIGVLAVSTANPFSEGDEIWQLITGLAERIGPLSD
jgi:GAF domain-containing protein